MTFFAEFVLLLIVLWMVYPVADIYPLNFSVQESIDTKSAALATDVPSIRREIANQVVLLKGNSPGSSNYYQDPMARIYMRTPKSVPPEIMLLNDEPMPSVPEHMTIAAWIKTDSAFSAIYSKFLGDSSIVCYSFGMDGVKYGGTRRRSCSRPIRWSKITSTSLTCRLHAL